MVPTAPLHRWVTRFGTAAGVTLFSDGLADTRARRWSGCGDAVPRGWRALARRPAGAAGPCRMARTDTARAGDRPIQARSRSRCMAPTTGARGSMIERLADDVLLPLRGETLRYNLRRPHAPAASSCRAMASPSALRARAQARRGSCCAA